MEIRDLRPEEYEEGGRVTRLAYEEYARASGSWEGWSEYLEELADIKGRADRTVVFGAFEDGRVLATATLEVDRTVGDDDAEVPPGAVVLRMLGVDPSARGRGIGRAMVEESLARTLALGRQELLLRTHESMLPAVRLYETMGFERVPDRDMQMESGVLIAYRMPV